MYKNKLTPAKLIDAYLLIPLIICHIGKCLLANIRTFQRTLKIQHCKFLIRFQFSKERHLINNRIHPLD